ncbi:MAG: hypothetical protein IPL46_26055 [Saprospiraceae bacterium]|nr:hypothetical protein [Saprospiraceae bacterium]
MEVIASDTSGDGTYYVPAQLLSQQEVLNAFVGTMKGGHDLIKTCEVNVLDEATSRWKPGGGDCGPLSSELPAHQNGRRQLDHGGPGCEPLRREAHHPGRGHQ